MGANDDAGFLYLFLALFPLVLLLLSWGHLRARWRLPIEQGKVPLYAGSAGGTVGKMGYRGPLINVRIYDDFLVLDGLQRVVLDFRHIERTELKKSWLGIGPGMLHIIHHQPQAPRRIQLSIFNPEHVKNLIDARLLHS